MLTLFRVYASDTDCDTIHDERFIFAETEDEAFMKGCGPDLSDFAQYLDFFWTCEEAAEFLERRDHDTVNELLTYLCTHVVTVGESFKPFKPHPKSPWLDDAYPVPSDDELAKQFPESWAVYRKTHLPLAAPEVVD